MTTFLKRVLPAAALAALVSTAALAHPGGHGDGEPAKPAPASTAAAAGAKAGASGSPYLLATDPVSGAALPAGKAVVRTHNGREFRFASEANWKTFEAAPDKYVAAVDKAMAEAQRGLYPLEVCPVSGEKLGSMGDPVDLVVDNRLVRLCCSGCVGKAKADPAAAFKKIDEAVIKVQKVSYPTKMCVVSDEPLGSMGDPVDVVAGTRLVRLCCQSCLDQFKADPASFVAAVEAAGAKKKKS
jgi:YHS domain-containing protein